MPINEVFQQLGLDSIDEFTPNRGMLVVQREAREERAHGIIIVNKRGEEGVRFEPSFARVIKHGACELTPKTRQPIAFETSVGDRVCVSRFAGHDVQVRDGTKYVVLAESDVHFIDVEERSYEQAA